MDLLPELETMAANAVDDLPHASDSDAEPDVSTRRQHLSSLTPTEARGCIQTSRSNLSHQRVSAAHGGVVRSVKEAEGHDRESCEYSLSLVKGVSHSTNIAPTREGAPSTFLLKLEEPLSTAAAVQEAGGGAEEV